MFNLNNLTKKFILSEGVAPTINSWIQALNDNIRSLNPSSVSDKRRVEVMKHQLTELKRSSRRMQEEIRFLQEQVSILEEGNKNE